MDCNECRRRGYCLCPKHDFNMKNRKSVLREFLFEVIELNITPENVLQSLMSHWLSPVNFGVKDREPFQIFLACMHYMRNKILDDRVEDVWEDIFRKTVEYTSVCSATRLESLGEYADGIGWVHDRELGFAFVPDEGVDLITWLDDVLKNCCNCPDPYIRLELLRLRRLFSSNFEYGVMVEQLPFTFIYTLSEIQPHCLLPSGNEREVLFDIFDLKIIIEAFNLNDDLETIISYALYEQFNNLNKTGINTKVTKFLTHCIQLIEVFAIIAGFNPDPKVQDLEIRCCLNMFGILLSLYKWKRICYHITRPPFQHYVLEAVREITVAITRIREAKVRQLVMSKRDELVSDLEVYDITNDLPKLLISHQLYCSSAVKQHALLLLDKNI